MCIYFIVKLLSLHKQYSLAVQGYRFTMSLYNWRSLLWFDTDPQANLFAGLPAVSEVNWCCNIRKTRQPHSNFLPTCHQTKHFQARVHLHKTPIASSLTEFVHFQKSLYLIQNRVPCFICSLVRLFYTSIIIGTWNQGGIVQVK